MNIRLRRARTIIKDQKNIIRYMRARILELTPHSVPKKCTQQGL